MRLEFNLSTQVEKFPAMMASSRCIMRRFSQLANASGSGPLTATTGSGVPTSFYPRVNHGPHGDYRRKGSSWKPILLFTAANALPAGALVYYLQQSIEARQNELMRVAELLEIPPTEAVSRIESICRSSANTLLLTSEGISPILPHMPESALLVLTSDEIVDNVDQTIPGTADLFDSITASRDAKSSSPLSFVHFGLSKNSSIAQRLLHKKDRNMSLVYNGGALSDMSVSVTGTAMVVEDERLRRFYWRDRWASYIPRDDYILVKLVPTEARINSLNGGEALVDGLRFAREDQDWKRV